MPLRIAFVFVTLVALAVMLGTFTCSIPYVINYLDDTSGLRTDTIVLLGKLYWTDFCTSEVKHWISSAFNVVSIVYSF